MPTMPITASPLRTSPSSSGQLSASDVVFLGIVRGLESQGFVPGQRLVETDLVAQFGVGRNSVREALQRLAADGFVDLHRHRGASIRSLSLQEALDVLDVAEPMTGLLASVAAHNIAGAGHAAKLKAALKGLAQADSRRDPVAFTTARRHFYRSLLDIGGNRELSRLFPAIQMHLVHAQFRSPELHRLRVDDYKKIGAAVLAGSSAVAQACGAAHVRHVRQAIQQIAASEQRER